MSGHLAATVDILSDAVELHDLTSPPHQASTILSGPVSGVGQNVSSTNEGTDHLDDGSSVSDEDFEDALDHLSETHEDVDRVSSSRKATKKRFIARLFHNINTTLVAAAMVFGMIFAYFQYKQQAWSNQMSALQTCLALEEASDEMANSPFCQKILHQGVHSLGTKRNVQQAKDSKTLLDLASKIQIPIVTMLITVFIIIISLASMIRKLTEVQMQYSPTGSEQFLPTIHVPLGIARLWSVKTKRLTTTYLRWFKDDTGGNDEHQFYLQSQAELTQKMNNWVWLEHKSWQYYDDHEVLWGNEPDKDCSSVETRHFCHVPADTIRFDDADHPSNILLNVASSREESLFDDLELYEKMDQAGND